MKPSKPPGKPTTIPGKPPHAGKKLERIFIEKDNKDFEVIIFSNVVSIEMRTSANVIIIHTVDGREFRIADDMESFNQINDWLEVEDD